MSAPSRPAPGHPGNPPHWTGGAKTGVGTAFSTESPVWFTLHSGVLTEVFYPEVDSAALREMQFLVADGKDFFSEEKTDTISKASYLWEGVPAYQIINTCKQGRYRIEKTILTDPHRPSLMQRNHWVDLRGGQSSAALYVLLSPHLGNQGRGNTAWVGEYKGIPMLFAQRENATVALACSVGWLQYSVGFVGVSDGWQDISRHKRLTQEYDRAEDGCVALTAQIDPKHCGDFTLVLGFGQNEYEAGHQARASLLAGFETTQEIYLKQWNDWKETFEKPKTRKKNSSFLYYASAAVMRTHESKLFRGATIASLATPWGSAHGDKDLGYHLVWPRDMIETVGGLLAIKAHEHARRILRYLNVTQEEDGHWPQNMFISGEANFTGIQLDESAMVIYLVDLAYREKALQKKDLAQAWPMVRSAAGYLVQHGPRTPMDRWEEEAGYFASTLAVEIAALLIAAELGEIQGEHDVARYLRETADSWNGMIDELIYVTGTELAKKVGVDGYYVRFAAPDQRQFSAPATGEITLKNHAPGQGKIRLNELVSVDALLLVRFGLRAADDPRMVNTVKVIDYLLKVDTPFGPGWHRYNEDGYGEHADGAPFDGVGVGRAWPLLVGERAHYELAAGRLQAAEELMRTMEKFANECGMLPEQIWDARDIPEKNLFIGRPSGSAMPLVWAHAEYIKLHRSLQDGRIFDLPPQPVQRYIVEKRESNLVFWRADQACGEIAEGKILRIELFAAAQVRWSTDAWRTANVGTTQDTGLGIYFFDLPTEKLSAGSDVVFTFQWSASHDWEGKDHQVRIGKPSGRMVSPENRSKSISAGKGSPLGV